MRAFRVLISVFLNLADLIGINRLFRLLNRHKIRVLMYHGLSSNSVPLQCWTLLECNKFAWQMEYVKRVYRAQPASVLLDDTLDPVSDSVIITFDDGMISVYGEAWPVLKRLRLPALLFVLPALSEQGDYIWADQILVRLMSTDAEMIDLSQYGLDSLELHSDNEYRQASINDLLTRLKAFPHERREEVVCHIKINVPAGSDEPRLAALFELINRDQICEMGEDDLIEIAGHTDSHPILSTQSRAEQELEIVGCLKKLKSWGVHATPVFAYPNGRPCDFDSVSMNILSEQGIHHAVSSVDGLYDRTDDSMSIKRVAIGVDISKAEFKARLSGLYAFLQRLAGKSGY